MIAASVDDLKIGTSGCTVSNTAVSLGERSDWLLVLGFLGWLGFTLRRSAGS